MKTRYYPPFLTIVLMLLLVASSGAQPPPDVPKIPAASSQPLFMENKGQFLSLEKGEPLDNILFKMGSPKGDLYITTRGLSYVFFQLKTTGKKRPAPTDERHYQVERVDMNLLHAHIDKKNMEITVTTGNTHYNYYRKNKIVENLPPVEKIRIREIYPGIDWVLSIHSVDGHSTLKQDFLLQPGADTRQLVFGYSSNAKIAIDSSGGILVKSRLGQIAEARPTVYEAASKTPIPVGVARAHNNISYVFPEAFVHTRTIVDPDLFWGTFLTSDVTGINYNDAVSGNDLLTDNAGNIFVLLTVSQGVSFPTLNPGNGAFYKDFAASPNGGMVITKFSKDGVLLWSTFYGDATAGIALAIDPSGNIYAVGSGSNVNILTQFSNSGQLLWNMNWGDGEVLPRRAICDSKGNFYFTGITNYPFSLPQADPGGGAYFQNANGIVRPFITEFTPAHQMIWSTPIAGTDYFEGVNRMAIDHSDNLYLDDDSVRMFNTNHQEVWTENQFEFGPQDIAIDKQDNLFMVGYGPAAILQTDPGNGAFIDHTLNPGISTGFIAKFNPAHQIIWSTSLFNQDMTDLYRVVVDQHCDAIHIFGVMNSFPIDVPTMDNSCNGDFYFTNSQFVTTYAPVFITFKNSGRMVYCSLSNFPYNYYDQNLSVTGDPFGNMIYLFGHLFEDVPAAKDPGNGAFFQASHNNVSIASFLMKMTPAKISASISITNPSGCNCNGSAAINVLCGAPPYAYSWSTGETTASVSGLCTGKHTVTVTDDDCNDSIFAFVVPPAPGSISGFVPTIGSEHCNLKDGRIDISSVQGGTPPYLYGIDNQAPQNSGAFSGLGAGNHLVSVTDANGCPFKDSVTVTSAQGPDSIYTTAVTASCLSNDGSLQIDSIRHGTLPFQYSLNASPFGSPASFGNLSAGAYYVQVKDSAGCLKGDSVKIPAAVPPSGAQFTIISAHCGRNDGSFSIPSVTGGSAPYSYSMDNATYRILGRFDSLLPGSYPVYVKDARNCLLTGSVTIPEVKGPSSLSLNVIDAICNAHFGSMTVQQLTGGVAPFSFSLDSVHFRNTGSFDSLIAGKYALYLLDSAGCSLSETFQILATSNTPVKIVPADTVVCYGQPVTFFLLPAAGPALKSYNWNNGSGTGASFTLTVAEQTAIILSAANSDNCISADTAIVQVKDCDSLAENCVHFPNAFTPNHDGRNDQFGAIAHCPVTAYQLQIFNRYGELIFVSTDISKRWDGRANGMLQESGNYVFTCEYTLGGLKKTKKGSVILLR